MKTLLQNPEATKPMKFPHLAQGGRTGNIYMMLTPNRGVVLQMRNPTHPSNFEVKLGDLITADASLFEVLPAGTRFTLIQEMDIA